MKQILKSAPSHIYIFIVSKVKFIMSCVVPMNELCKMIKKILFVYRKSVANLENGTNRFSIGKNLFKNIIFYKKYKDCAWEEIMKLLTFIIHQALTFSWNIFKFSAFLNDRSYWTNFSVLYSKIYFSLKNLTW